MRAGLNTIQQTLTPEAANVLNMSIAEAGRRNHGQTTPLHVAATLLASPSGFLRQACIRSHPNSSHPLQCRALELCFSVALERLPAAQGQPPAMEPPISNALLAALKRAQAHQRRGCPEQQQQPLLAVKVELEQLIISILDDPSVSRVMREASFSSPAVKATIEQSLISQPAATAANPAAVIGIGFRPNPVPMSLPNRNMYLNPRLQQGNSVQSGQQRSEEIKRISDIFLKDKKRNPILVGESEPQSLIKELIKRIEKGQLSEGSFKNIEVIQLDKDLVSDKSQLPTKILELGGLIASKIGDSRSGGVVIDLGDLKWLVEPGGAVSGGTQPPAVAEAGRAAVVEMAKLLARFGDGENGRIWLIGTATCETYLRCQIYHPTMENDWNLQAVPIAPRSPFPGMFPRLGGHGILNGSVESLNPLKNFQNATTLPRCVPESLEAARKLSCCPQCTESYEQELAKLVAKEYEKSSSEGRSEPARTSLPQWLQNVKVDNGDSKPLDQSQTRDQEMMFKQKSQELQRKWKDTCLRSHPHFHHNPSSERVAPTNLPMTSLINPKLLVHQPLQQKSQPNKTLGATLQLNHDPDHPRPGLINPKLLIHQPLLQKSQPNKSLGVTLQLNLNPKINQSSEQANSPPRSPVRTDLILGRPKVREPAPESPHKDRVKDLLGCISSDFQIEKFSKALDTDSYKKLLKGLMEKVWWQKEAASAVASAVTKCKEGNGRRRGTLSKGDTWLLFTGPDRVGKKKMVSVISEQVCGSNPIMICLGPRRSDEELEMNFRGKTVLDRIVEAVRRNPFSVIMLEDIEEADMLVRGSIKRAMERGRLADSYGREISLGNVIFILTANWLPDNLAKISDDQMLDEKKLASISSGGWQLRLCIGQKSAKRRAEWLYDEDRLTKPRKELCSGLSLDLNLAADFEDDRTDGSFNSSDLTVDHEDDRLLENGRFMITSVPIELANYIDEAIIFKPVDIVSVRREIRSKILEKFSSTIDNCSIELEDEALEKILGGVWLGRTGLEEWAEKVLGPSFRQMKTCLPSSSDDKVVVRLEIDGYSGSRITGDWLPDSIGVS